jgi:hypothetical protein
MKSFMFATIAVFVLFAGLASAQATPAPNARVTSTFGGEIVTATDGDDTCVFIGPFPKLAGLPPSDDISIKCYVFTAPFTQTLVSTTTISLIGFTSASSSFSANTHTFDWKITKLGPGNFTWDITLDKTSPHSLHFVGVF